MGQFIGKIQKHWHSRWLKKKDAPVRDRQKKDGAIQPTMLHREPVAGLKRSNKLSSIHKSYSCSRKEKKRVDGIGRCSFFLSRFCSLQRKRRFKSRCCCWKSFSKKKITQIQRHLWVFFKPCGCAEIDSKSRSTNASIANSVIATEASK